MQKRYYHEVVKKNDPSVVNSALKAIEQAQTRQRIKRLGSWTAKRIGQTPRVYLFLVRNMF